MDIVVVIVDIVLVVFVMDIVLVVVVTNIVVVDMSNNASIKPNKHVHHQSSKRCKLVDIVVVNAIQALQHLRFMACSVPNNATSNESYCETIKICYLVCTLLS